MPTIIPAILTNDKIDLERKLRILEGFALTVHLDVEDGQFVPRATLPLPELMAAQTSLTREYHLMMADPWPSITDPLAAAAARLIIHVETITDSRQFLVDLPRVVAPLALAVNPGTSLEPWLVLMRTIGRVMLMGVEPGAQGAPFVPATIGRVAVLRRALPNLEISVDGGVDVATAPQLVAVGADRLVVGSAIWQSEDPEGTFHQLSRLPQLT